MRLAVFRIARFYQIALWLFLLLPALAAEAATPRQEIDHLLDFIAASPCAFIRNDVEYPAPEALAHIQDKYDYYRDQIATAEDFIDLAASKSMMSGRLYMVRCDATPMPAGDWLRQELATYRKQQP